MKNFHIPLPANLYSQFREEAKEAQMPATKLARLVITQWLEQREREAAHQSISEYAKRWAGTDVDLDPELEAAGIEHVLESEP